MGGGGIKIQGSRGKVIWLNRGSREEEERRGETGEGKESEGLGGGRRETEDWRRGREQGEGRRETGEGIKSYTVLHRVIHSVTQCSTLPAI